MAEPQPTGEALRALTVARARAAAPRGLADRVAAAEASVRALSHRVDAAERRVDAVAKAGRDGAVARTE